MEKKRVKAKTAKKKWVTINFECDQATLDRLNSISKLAHTTLDQTVAVILSTYIIDKKQLKNNFGEKTKVSTPKNVISAYNFGLGDK